MFIKTYTVWLKYFKKNGTYYTQCKYTTEKLNIFQIYEEVRQMKINKELPGAYGSNHIILIDVPTHPDNCPKLIF